MRFEVSERVKTSATKSLLLKSMEEQFRKVSESTQPYGESLEVKDIEASFGSINRNDTTIVEVKDVDDGYLLIANVHYRPSVAFWIILIITLFTWVGWLIPIVMYIWQRKVVQNGIQEVFTRIRNEYTSSKGEKSDLDQLQKLAQLRDCGVLTDQEFQAKKKELLGISPVKHTAPTPVVCSTIQCPLCGKDIAVQLLKVGMNSCPHCSQVFQVQ